MTHPYAILSISAAALLASASGVLAQNAGIGRPDPNPTGSQTTFSGSLGEDFLVGSQPIVVNGLGAFDSGGGTISNITVEIFRNSDQTVIAGPLSISGAPATPGLAFTEGYLFAGITPVTLSANTSYRVVAYGFGPGQPNGNPNDLRGQAPDATGDPNNTGLISFPATGVGTGGQTPTNSYYGFVNGQPDNGYPTVGDSNGTGGSSINMYSGGSFLFAAVPEPSSWMGAGGLLLLAISDFRRRRKA